MKNNIESEIKIKLLEEKFGEDEFLYSLVLPFIMHIKRQLQDLDDSKFNKMIKEYIGEAMRINRPILEYLIKKNTKELEKNKNHEGILENEKTLNILNEKNNSILSIISDYKMYLIIGAILILLFVLYR
jgi:hypothetical protein